MPFYTYYVKYPRTYHCPWSGYMSKDDRVQENLSLFNKNLVITEKLDGENTTMYNDYIHARSIDGNSHWTQSWVKQLHSQIGYNIPEGWRIIALPQDITTPHLLPGDAVDVVIGESVVATDCLVISLKPVSLALPATVIPAVTAASRVGEVFIAAQK